MTPAEVMERVEAWEQQHGPCPRCPHGYLRHVGMMCYGARAHGDVTIDGRTVAVETLGHCPCNMQALPTGWTDPSPELLLA